MIHHGVAAVGLMLAFAAHADAPQTWPISSQHSFVQFSVRTLWFTHERGRFEAVYGQLRRSGAERDVVDAWIDAGSLQMDDTRALEEARGPGFFDVAKYPRIHFVSLPFADALLREGGTLEGILDLHGERRWVQFTLQPSACPEQPLTCAIQLQGKLSRSAFGMRAHRALLSDKVALDLNIVLGEPG